MQRRRLDGRPSDAGSIAYSQKCLEVTQEQQMQAQTISVAVSKTGIDVA